MRRDDILEVSPVDFSPRGKGRLIATLALLGGAIALFLIVWGVCFKYVPTKKHLVLTAKFGKAMPPDHRLAENDEQGIRRKVLGEGWHFVMPIAYESELEDNTLIPPGKVGIVTSQGGEPLPPGVLATDDRQKGIQKNILTPGMYRLNLKGYSVELVDAVEIKAGWVGVQRRLLGVDSAGRFAERDEEKGILHELLQPGMYYVNNREYEIIKAEVGIEQTTFHAPDKDHPKDTSIEFTSRGGFKIKIDCTIEWEVLPQDMPALVAEFGTVPGPDGPRANEEKVVGLAVIQPAQAIIRDKGIEYGVKDLLVGSNREKFQADFSKELKDRAKLKNVVIHSAFIRNITIPDDYMKEIRDKQIAAETNLTNKYREETAKSDAQVKTEQAMIEQKVKQVEYETAKLVTALDTEASNVTSLNAAEVEKLNQEYQAKIAEIDAQAYTELSKAKTDITKLKETSRNNLYKLKMDVFKGDGDAFLRYSMADQLNPNLRVRLFHSGPGTFWTNMGDKNFNFLMPTNAGTGSEKNGASSKPPVGPSPPDKNK
jgi:hypothetical protein